MLAHERKVSEPKFRPEPTRLSPEARLLLDELRTEHISIHEYYRRDGYIVVGGVSQFDAWMLRAGEVLNLLAVRRSVIARVKRKLEEKYGQKGKAVDVRGEVGAIFVKHSVRQRDIVSKKDFSFHPRGLIFYVRYVDQQPEIETFADVRVNELGRRAVSLLPMKIVQ